MQQMTRAASKNGRQKRVWRPTLSTGAGTRQCGGGRAAGQGAKNRACPVAFFGVRPKMGLKFRAKSVGQKPEHSTWSILLNIKSSDGHSAVQVRVCPRFRTGTLEHKKKQNQKNAIWPHASRPGANSTGAFLSLCCWPLGGPEKAGRGFGGEQVCHGPSKSVEVVLLGGLLSSSASSLRTNEM